MNFIVRLIYCTLIIYISDLASLKINFSEFWQVVLLAVSIAVIGYATDSLLLNRFSVLSITWFDTIIFTLIIWSSGWIFLNSYITFAGAFFAGILLGFSEYLEHRSIIKVKRREII